MGRGGGHGLKRLGERRKVSARCYLIPMYVLDDDTLTGTLQVSNKARASSLSARATASNNGTVVTNMQTWSML